VTDVVVATLWAGYLTGLSAPISLEALSEALLRGRARDLGAGGDAGTRFGAERALRPCHTGALADRLDE
jgi:hypothetical protein